MKVFIPFFAAALLAAPFAFAEDAPAAAPAPETPAAAPTPAAEPAPAPAEPTK